MLSGGMYVSYMYYVPLAMIHYCVCKMHNTCISVVDIIIVEVTMCSLATVQCHIIVKKMRSANRFHSLPCL